MDNAARIWVAGSGDYEQWGVNAVALSMWGIAKALIANNLPYIDGRFGLVALELRLNDHRPEFEAEYQNGMKDIIDLTEHTFVAE